MNSQDDLFPADANANLDPISGKPGAHPVGTGIGAALGGAAAGAATGTLAGPIGTLVGTAAGAIAGALAGKGLAEALAPTDVSAYWRDHYAQRDYVEPGARFEDYGPAYSFGASARGRYPGRRFDEVEAEMASYWNASRGDSGLSWERARLAARDAWMRLDDTAGTP